MSRSGAPPRSRPTMWEIVWSVAAAPGAGCGIAVRGPSAMNSKKAPPRWARAPSRGDRDCQWHNDRQSPQAPAAPTHRSAERLVEVGPIRHFRQEVEHVKDSRRRREPNQNLGRATMLWVADRARLSICRWPSTRSCMGFSDENQRSTVSQLEVIGPPAAVPPSPCPAADRHASRLAIVAGYASAGTSWKAPSAESAAPVATRGQ